MKFMFCSGRPKKTHQSQYLPDCVDETGSNLFKKITTSLQKIVSSSYNDERFALTAIDDVVSGHS